jgi:hypothetical protein
MMVIEHYLEKFKEAGIAIQITLDIEKPVTIHAIDFDRTLHMTEDEMLVVALKKMEEKLL